MALDLTLILFSSQPPVPQTMQGEGPSCFSQEAVSRAAKAAGARPLTKPEPEPGPGGTRGSGELQAAGAPTLKQHRDGLVGGAGLGSLLPGSLQR